jgi:hypothetical protein
LTGSVLVNLDDQYDVLQTLTIGRSLAPRYLMKRPLVQKKITKES